MDTRLLVDFTPLIGDFAPYVLFMFFLVLIYKILIYVFPANPVLRACNNFFISVLTPPPVNHVNSFNKQLTFHQLAQLYSSQDKCFCGMYNCPNRTEHNLEVKQFRNK